MKLVSIVGARPQFVKLGPISQAIGSHNSRHTGDSYINHAVIHTGQHYDLQLSDVFFREIDLPTPQVNLGVGSGPHGKQTGRMIEQLERILVECSPDIVLVYGDTNSTLAAALAAAKLHIPIAHVEAGLRSFNKGMPEEINRVLTDHASTLLFCPTRKAVENLRHEGFTNIVNEGHLVSISNLDCDLLPAVNHELRTTNHAPIIINIGDVMYDVYLTLAERADAESDIVQRLNLKVKDYALVTIHRAENTDDPERLRGILEGIRSLAKDSMRCVLPIHPRTRTALSHLGDRIDCSALEIIDPIGYLDMLKLERNARMILTDSGGVQKEAYFSQIPCVTLREETEWVELVEAGWNWLGGAEPAQIQDAIRHAFAFDRAANQATLLYGDGHASERIVQLLKDWWARV